jgi:hypothetical protein
MTQFEKLKSEIAEMDIDKFLTLFISEIGMKQYICGEIKHPKAHCTKTDDYRCAECLREYLRSEVEE